MAAAKTETLNAGDKFALFLQKYRRAFWGLLGIVIAGIIGSVLFFTVRNALQNRAIVTLEAFETRKTDLGDLADTSKSMEIQALLEEINAFAPKTFGYASAKAYSLAADIYAARGEWALAEEAWAASAERASRIYLAPLSLYSAAVAAEEQGNLDKALEYYTRTLAFSGVFPASQRAQFNIGRIYEARNDKEAASEAYRNLIEKSSPDSNWAKLAQSRIIFLEME
ncbi:MAG: tetratricopeptide repeat protein [Spirochaetaceae bacterium]|jgi:tetratricopeptide (TPR) repeat protein|nr:tetratricopeptide repeat protein [Spirochaetaceae bacterium]